MSEREPEIAARGNGLSSGIPPPPPTAPNAMGEESSASLASPLKKEKSKKEKDPGDKKKKKKSKKDKGGGDTLENSGSMYGMEEGASPQREESSMMVAGGGNVLPTSREAVTTSERDPMGVIEETDAGVPIAPTAPAPQSVLLYSPSSGEDEERREVEDGEEVAVVAQHDASPIANTQEESSTPPPLPIVHPTTLSPRKQEDGGVAPGTVMSEAEEAALPQRPPALEEESLHEDAQQTPLGLHPPSPAASRNAAPVVSIYDTGSSTNPVQKTKAISGGSCGGGAWDQEATTTKSPIGKGEYIGGGIDGNGNVGEMKKYGSAGSFPINRYPIRNLKRAEVFFSITGWLVAFTLWICITVAVASIRENLRAANPRHHLLTATNAAVGSLTALSVVLVVMLGSQIYWMARVRDVVESAAGTQVEVFGEFEEGGAGDGSASPSSPTGVEVLTSSVNASHSPSSGRQISSSYVDGAGPATAGGSGSPATSRNQELELRLKQNEAALAKVQNELAQVRIDSLPKASNATNKVHYPLIVMADPQGEGETSDTPQPIPELLLEQQHNIVALESLCTNLGVAASHMGHLRWMAKRKVQEENSTPE